MKPQNKCAGRLDAVRSRLACFLGSHQRVLALTAVMCVASVFGAFAQAPTLTVDFASFGSGVLDAVQSALTAVIPYAAVLFGVMVAIRWVKGIL